MVIHNCQMLLVLSVPPKLSRGVVEQNICVSITINTTSRAFRSSINFKPQRTTTIINMPPQKREPGFMNHIFSMCDCCRRLGAAIPRVLVALSRLQRKNAWYVCHCVAVLPLWLKSSAKSWGMHHDALLLPFEPKMMRICIALGTE